MHMSEVSELLDRLRRGSELAVEAAVGLTPEEVDWSPGPGVWSARQVLCHLSDSEAVGTMRFRQVLAEENPVIQWYDEAAKTDYHRRDASVALSTFVRLRRQNYELLQAFENGDPSVWDRKGVHTKYGEKTLVDLLRIYAEHAEGHSRQLRKVREQFRESRTTDQ
jgi:hypothetical protein